MALYPYSGEPPGGGESNESSNLTGTSRTGFDTENARN